MNNKSINNNIIIREILVINKNIIIEGTLVKKKYIYNYKLKYLKTSLIKYI